MLKSPLPSEDLESDVMDRVEGLHAMTAMLQYGIHGWGGMCPTEEDLNNYVQLMRSELDALRRDLGKIDWTEKQE